MNDALTPTTPEHLMRKLSFSRIFFTSLLSLAALLTAAWFGGRIYLGGSLMPLEGSQNLAGLERQVKILFDQRGIPRIYANTDTDALRALGWLHAGERMFQMELLRKVARGEISEIVGRAGLQSDILHRQYGFARTIRQNPPKLAPETRGLLQAYVAGINARIDSDLPLPPSFVLMGRQPEPWTVDDVLVLAYYQTWYPTTLVQRLAEAWREAARVHGEAGSKWLETLPAWGLPSVPAQRMTEASNTWVVGPEKSASGHALHASDPHLDYTMAPGLWYAAGIHSEQSLDVVGVTVPGLPFVAMGHNGQIAFAFTVAPVDLFEVYRFERDRQQPDRLIGPDGTFLMTEQSESFRIRDHATSIERTHQTTPYGLVTDSDEQSVEVLYWAGFDLPVAKLIENGLAMNRARDFDAFRKAASDMGALSVNWSYSDIDGHIGYVQSTPIPRRRHDQFYTTLDGADPANHWDGFVGPDQRPFAFDPEQGWLANSNNHASIDSPWPMPGFYKHLRMRRASAWLESKPLFDRRDMHAMQMDYTSARALSWKGWLADTAEQTGRPQIAEQMRAWDGVMQRDSKAAGLFALWWQFLPRHLFSNSGLDDWRLGRILLDDWLNQAPSDFELAVLPRDEAARRALNDALEPGIRTLGQIQTLTIAHPLAQAGILDAWLNLSRGPIPIGGGPGSLNVTYHRFNEDNATLSAAAGASMRFVMDWADPDAFTLNLTLGNSGHPSSSHFDDQLADFLIGRPWTVPFDRNKVEARASSRLLLMPADARVPEPSA
ncbi:MAG: penicillin acylase family protein [Wenzhouxiangellaceae bacterium]|nr:penicillin acylase family protein [Wenzhouxiangellaceae bacterium]